MAKPLTVTVPDIGAFADVPVVEVLVSPGDRVKVETPLVTLESDKATMDVPAPQAGTVESILIAVGDTVSEGAALLTLAIDTVSIRGGTPEASNATAAANDSGDGSSGEAGASETVASSAATTEAAVSYDAPYVPVAPDPVPEPLAMRTKSSPALSATVARVADIEAEVVVLGAGPGGYTAAFRAADLGLRTVLVERYPTLGGVCLNVGCIPSKALLHAAAVIDGAGEMAAHGIDFGAPSIDLPNLADWKSKVVGRLTQGLAGLAKKRKIQVVHGTGTFSSPHRLSVAASSSATEIGFERAIIAAGSQVVEIPGFPSSDPRLMDSTDALVLDDVPGRLLVIGGGIIGLEMATVYAALGSRVTVVELMDGLIPGCDRDLVKPLEQRVRTRYESIRVSTRVTAVSPEDSGLRVTFEDANGDGPSEEVFDRVLVAVGRRPNGYRIGAENAGVHVDERGFIPADRRQCTNVGHIFAIGDIAGEPMLAHKATHEGKVAAEVCAGHNAGFDALAIPSVAYTDPEVAWTGLTETEARDRGVEFDKATFPWAASGRALGIGRSEGLTKVLFDKQTGRLVGAGIVGPHAGDLIAEATLAIEMGADARDIGLTIHPHPTLSETINFAAEMVEGTITDLYAPRRRG